MVGDFPCKYLQFAILKIIIHFQEKYERYAPLQRDMRRLFQYRVVLNQLSSSESVPHGKKIASQHENQSHPGK